MTALTQIAIGWNNTGGLADILVQPDYDGAQRAREIYATSGDVFEDGALFVELRFPEIQSAEDWVSVLAQFGLSTEKTVRVTIKLLNLDKVTRTVYNGKAIRPKVTSWKMCWYENPVILVRKLVAI